MTMESAIGGDYFTTYSFGDKYCMVHGYFYGISCPSCTSVPIYSQPQPQVNVVTIPTGTEDAIKAIVLAYDQIVESLRREKRELEEELEQLRSSDSDNQQVPGTGV